MSRSIHTTRRSVEDVKRDRYADRDQKRQRIEEFRDQLGKKRRIKQHVRGLGRVGTPLAVGDVSCPQIQAVHPLPGVQFPAGPSDLEALIAKLPQGVAEGISEIRLELGAEAQIEHAASDTGPPPDPDPLVGRLGVECFPGVFSGEVLGQYFPDRSRIHLYAYVFNDDHPQRKVLVPYLRLRMLSTFVHEIAHHYDFCWRTRGNRWRADDTDKNEMYAEAIEHDWVAQYVVPLVLERYPEEYEELSQFFFRHAGVDLPIYLLAGDPRMTAGRGLFRWVYPVTEALGSILEGLDEGSPPSTIRLEVARDLRCAAHYDHALVAVDAVLANDPTSREARVVKAEIFERAERYEEAHTLVTSLLADEPLDIKTLEVKVNLAFSTHRWERLARTIETLRVIDAQALSQRFLVMLARAYLELERWDDFDALVVEVIGAKSKFTRARALSLRALSLLRRGRLESSLEAAESGIQEFEGLWDKYLFVAIRLDTLAHLGRQDEASPVDSHHLEAMRRLGFGTWTERIEELSGAAAKL